MFNKRRQKKYIYGKFHHDTFEFHQALHDLFSNFFEKYPKLNIELHNDIVELRNKIIALLDSWIGAKKLETKFGIKIPLSSTPVSIKSFLEKQARSYSKKYRACEICGEKRITNFCHIIPYAEGGPDDEKNYLFLCPTHHHLFDQHRLSKGEWNKIDFSKKLETARVYVKKITLPILKKYWRENK